VQETIQLWTLIGMGKAVGFVHAAGTNSLEERNSHQRRSEPPFAITQFVLLIIFVVLPVIAILNSLDKPA